MIRLSSYPDDMIGGLAANAATGWSIGQLLPQVQGVVLGWRPLRDTVAESTVADVAAEKSSASGHLQRPRRDKQPPLDIDSTGRNGNAHSGRSPNGRGEGVISTPCCPSRSAW
jgi:hypothetical protein